MDKAVTSADGCNPGLQGRFNRLLRMKSEYLVIDRIGPGFAPCVGTEQDDLARIYLPHDRVGHLFEKFVGDLKHGVFFLSLNPPPPSCF